MASVQQNLTGKRVYRNSSFAPTRGTNNPSGYIERELRNNMQARTPYQGVSKSGTDGQSDTRSGLAATALGGRPMVNTQTRTTGASPTALGGKPAGSNGMPVTPGFVPAQAPAKSPAQVVQISPTGQLNLPFDYKYAQEALTQKSNMNSALLALQQETQAAAQDYLRNRNKTDQAFGEANRNTLNDNAARGTAFSSGYGRQVGKNATSYNNAINELDMQNNQTQTNAIANRNQIQQAYNDFLRQQALARANDLHQQAGTLNLGKK